MGNSDEHFSDQTTTLHMRDGTTMRVKDNPNNYGRAADFFGAALIFLSVPVLLIWVFNNKWEENDAT